MSALCSFVLFYDEGMSVGVGVTADGGDLPGNLHASTAAGNDEVVAGQLFCNVERSEGANRSELVMEVLVESSEPGRQRDSRPHRQTGKNSTKIVDLYGHLVSYQGLK